MMMPDVESDLLTRSRSQEIFAHVERKARSLGIHDVEAIITAEDQALTRFANNTIHQNVAERSRHLSVRVLLDGRTARASTNRLDEEAIRAAVEEAAAIARCQDRDPDLLPLAEPAIAPMAARWFSGTATVSPEARAAAVAEAIRLVLAAGQVAAGIYSTGESVIATCNSRSLFAYHAETMARFSITAMTDDSSGWAKGSACSYAALNVRELAERAVRKAAASRTPIELTPGHYTVILEPSAVSDLVGQMFGDFSATALRDGRSFLQDRRSEE